MEIVGNLFLSQDLRELAVVLVKRVLVPDCQDDLHFAKLLKQSRVLDVRDEIARIVVVDPLVIVTIERSRKLPVFTVRS
jgi:hypothetical protein